MNNMFKIIRIIARIASVIMVLLMAVFFIGEGIINNLDELKVSELILLIFVPVTLFIGTFIAWKKEFIGGIIISGSIVLFNIMDMILFNKKMISFNFISCFLIGLLFIIVGINNKSSHKL